MTNNDSYRLSRRGLKNTLREMPSTFFARESKPSTSAADTRPPSRKSKRKALTSFLKFGSGRFADASPMPASPGLAQPAVSGALGSIRSGSVRSTSVEPQNKPRPSCGPDPFGRGDDGARVVRVSFTPTKSTAAAGLPTRATSSCRRSSTSPVHRTGTCDISVISIDDLDDDDDPLVSSDESDDKLCRSPARKVEWTLSAPSPPSRRSTLSRASTPPQMSSVVEVDEATEAVVRVTGDAGADNDTKLSTCDLALKTGKHKSRVWGMFTKRKSKPMLGDAASIDRDAIPASVMPAGNERPSVPTLHITKPSVDSTAGPQLRSVTHKLFSSASPGSFRSGDGPSLRTADQPGTYAGIRLAPRPLPRRKSLAGLFGLTMKKSLGRLRPASPLRPEIAAPATPSQVSRSSINPDRINDSFMAEGSLIGPDFSMEQTTTEAMQVSTPSRVSVLRITRKTPSPARPAASPITPDLAMPTGKVTGTDDSPRKLLRFGRKADRRVNQPVTPTGKIDTPSPVKSMVKRGMRNIFAPPSPVRMLKYPASPSSVLDTPGPITSGNPKAQTPASPTVAGGGTVASQLPPPSGLPKKIYDRNNSKPPKLSLEFDRSSHHSSVISSSWFPASVQRHGSTTSQRSFNFDQHLAGLAITDAPRASFIEALSLAPPLNATNPSPFRPVPELREEFRRRASEKSLRSKASSQVDFRSYQPFQGQPAFQEYFKRTRTESHSYNAPPPFTLPVPPAGTVSRHQRDGSGVSLASISSLGAPFEFPMRDRPNFFDQAFGPPQVPLPPLPTQLQSVPHLSWDNNSPTRSCDHSYSRHRRGRTSLSSIESVEITRVSGLVDMRNMSRASLVRSIPRGSMESTVGRSDWASQRRQSTESVERVVDLGRPELGDRMFQVDSNVGLAAASPSSMTDGVYVSDRPLSYASAWSSEEPRSGESDSLFAEDFSPGDHASSSWLKGHRPYSGISEASMCSGDVDDTFDGHHSATQEIDLISAYEMDSPEANLPPPQVAQATSRHRRAKPPRLHLESQEPNTPGLISPSTSGDSASLFSIETMSFTLPMISYPRTRSLHAQQKASITSAVQVHPTIQEEPSQATLRGTRSGHLSSGPVSNNWEEEGSIDKYLAWYDKRESSIWTDSDVSDADAIETQLPQTIQEVEALLKKSSQMYRPLAQQLPHRNAHSTVKKSRASSSPYSTQPPALVTRYQNKRGSSSSEDKLPRISPLLTEFARDCTPSPLPSVIESHVKVKDMSSNPARASISPSVRRRNLGWARRRNSDEPTPNQRLSMPPKPSSAVESTFPSFLSFSPQTRFDAHEGKAPPATSIPSASRMSLAPRRRVISSRPHPPVPNSKGTAQRSTKTLSQVPVRTNPSRSAASRPKSTPMGSSFSVAEDKPVVAAKVKPCTTRARSTPPTRRTSAKPFAPRTSLTQPNTVRV